MAVFFEGGDIRNIINTKSVNLNLIKLSTLPDFQFIF